MIDASDIPELVGATVFDSSGDKIGKVGQVYLDDRSGAPQWVTVSTGLFGTKETFVPVEQARYADGALSVPVSKATVKDAPSIDEDGHLSPEQEQALYSHYGLPRDNADTQAAPPPAQAGAADSGPTDPETSDSSRSEDRADSADSADSFATDRADSSVADSSSDTDSADSTDSAEMAGVETMAMGAPPEATRSESTDPAGRDDTNTSLGARTESGPDSDSDDADGVTLSAERLHADTERVPTSRARLRKYVVTRMESIEVPVSREEVRVEREPISEEEAASMPTGEIGESDLEMILYEERVVVTKQTVPVERIRVATDTVTDTRTVSEEVQAEQAEFDRGDRGGQDRLPPADS